MPTLIEPAPAKVNLTLRVLGRRTDGMHEVESLVAFARDVCDRIELQPSAAGGLHVSGPFADAIVGANILDSAVDALQRNGLALGAISLVKNLPVAAGIGGGSADAAALLRAARKAYVHVPRAIPWAKIAAALGTDVPICVASTPALVSGTGQRIATIARFPPLHAVLVNPMAAVPTDKTARVFRALGLQAVLVPAADTPLPPTFRDAVDVMAHVASQRNDLTEAARTVVPEIGNVLEALAALPDCRVCRLSGAGATCFGLFDTATEADAAAAALMGLHPSWWVRPTLLS